MYAVEQCGNYDVVTPEHEINASNADQAKEFIKEFVGNGHRFLVIDLSTTVFLDSPALGVLVTAMKLARASGGNVRLCGLSKNLQQILELTRLNRVFELFPDRESALA